MNIIFDNLAVWTSKYKIALFYYTSPTMFSNLTLNKNTINTDCTVNRKGIKVQRDINMEMQGVIYMMMVMWQ